MKRTRGFSLVELLVTVGLLAILMSIAAPSFKRFIQAGRMSTSVNTFLADMRLARSEAIRRGGNVVVCRSDDPEAATASCGAGEGPNDKGWISGWIMFHDLNGNGARDAGEPVLKVQAASSDVDAIIDSGPSTKFRFTGTGRLHNLAAATSMHFGSVDNFAVDMQRMVCINASGRARIAGNGGAACGTDI